ncbi:MAG: thermonuclease family protein [Armatimonadetes bacterium]|nr:thermonuclease family protein [Armatimonadota bacterium]
MSLALLPREVVAQDAFHGTVIEIERGDQLSVKLDSWTLKVRLHGTVCPTSGELADVAMEWTKARVLGKQVNVGVRGTAAKGVVYGDLTYLPGEHNISIELVEQGLATWARQYAPNRRDLEAAEKRARDARAGVWGNLELEKIRLRQVIGNPKSMSLPPPSASPKPKTSLTPKISPSPVPAPTSEKNLLNISQGRPTVLWPLAVGILLAVGCLTGAEWVSRDARRLRQRPVLLADATNNLTPLKVRGLVRAQAELAVSIAGRIPGLYLHEVTQIFRDGAWRTTYNETDTTPFVLDDGTEQYLVPLDRVRFKPIRIARFYNDIPVEKWHARSYGGDIRTEVFFIPADITLTLYGVFVPSQTTPLLVVEGDERRLTHLPVQIALGLIVLAVTALFLGGYFTLLSAGLPS